MKKKEKKEAENKSLKWRGENGLDMKKKRTKIKYKKEAVKQTTIQNWLKRE